MNDFDDEKIIERFFAENRIRVEDNGFSRHVMHSLSDREARLNRLWTAFCALAGVVLLFAVDAFGWLCGTVSAIVEKTVDAVPVIPAPLMLAFLATTTFAMVSALAAVRVLR